jgi:multiple sugar transport system permease protein
MGNFAETGPSKPVTVSTRVDKVAPRARLMGKVRAFVVIAISLILLIPIFVMGMTAFKSRADVVSVPPKIIFQPTLEGFVYLLTERAVVPQSKLPDLQAAADEGKLNYFQRLALKTGQVITGPSDYVDRLKNSVIIAGLSTLFSVILGTFAAYAFSRFDIPGKDDLMFFILSTRMLPAVVVTIPLFLMYRQLNLHDTYVGMILLYTAFNLSLACLLYNLTLPTKRIV